MRPVVNIIVGKSLIQKISVLLLEAPKDRDECSAPHLQYPVAVFSQYPPETGKQITKV